MQERPVDPAGLEPASPRLALDEVRARPGLLSPSPGVYLFRDSSGQLLYVGKADSLRDRVRSYLAPSGPSHPRTRSLVARAHTVETIVTANRREALVLEGSLIRRHKPPYNVMLREGQRYPYVCFSRGPFPRLVVTRTPSAFPGPCHGPYTDVRSLRQALRLLRAVVPLRTCSDRQLHGRSRPCVLYEMRRCCAPCVGKVSEEGYRALVVRAGHVLEGRVRPVVRELRRAMARCVTELRYEEAAVLRDRIDALLRLTQRQKIVLGRPVDLDAVAVARAGTTAVVVARVVREGSLVAQRVMRCGHVHPDTSLPHLIEEALSRYYAAVKPPPRILVNDWSEALGAMGQWLGAVRGGSVRISQPRRGRFAEVLRSTVLSAQQALEEALTREAQWQRRVSTSVVRVAEVLGLDEPPRLIVGMDASQLAGEERVGVVVSFVEGSPRKSSYRRYHIRGTPCDDARMLAEVASRWIARVRTGELERPGLVLIDGGVAQVAAVAEALREAGVAPIEVIGLAKREEVIHRLDAPPLRLSRHDEALKLLQQVRDEAHRFALSFHRATRRTRLMHTQIEDIPGIGPRRAAALLARFGSVEGLREASRDAILATPGIGPRLADGILRWRGRV